MKLLVAEEVDGRGSGSGESGKTAGGEGDWWQGVSGRWRVVCGGSGRVSGEGTGWQAMRRRR